MTSYIIINDDIFMMTLHNVPVFQKWNHSSQSL